MDFYARSFHWPLDKTRKYIADHEFLSRILASL